MPFQSDTKSMKSADTLCLMCEIVLMAEKYSIDENGPCLVHDPENTNIWKNHIMKHQRKFSD